MALRLARYFGTSPDVWIDLQADYDLYWARMKSKKAIDEIKPHMKSKAA
jgi:plasmid maintenance system antidote protein VapI